MASLARWATPDRARWYVLLATLAPMMAWPLGPGRLARPWDTAAAALLCALLAATAPGRSLRWVAWLLLLLLPATLSWVGAVASTGTGPSVASAESLTAGALKEVTTALGAALLTPAFQVVALLCLLATGLALAAAQRDRRQPGGASALVFLVCLLPPALMTQGAAAGWAWRPGPEAQLSVPWLFQLGVAREALAGGLDRMTMMQLNPDTPVRSARDAAKTFDAAPGLGLFVIGESLRADSLLRPGRGSASASLQRRLDEGLGVRLPDACAGGNGTFVSVPPLLTLSDSPDPARAAGRPTLLALAKAAGASTAYINNHEIWVVPESGHDLSQKLSDSYSTALDSLAIEAMENFVLRSDAAAKAVLIHLYGQHFFYADRYPARQFGAEPPGLGSAALQALRYQRAAEYGAGVLERAAGFMDRLTVPAFLVFTSDHGENLELDGSGRQFHAGPANGRHDTLVPALVLWNRAFARSGRASALAPLREAEGPIAHRDLALAWLRLMGADLALRPTAEPLTWGALRAGEPIGPLRCADLGP